MNPLRHYLQRGVLEGRDPNPLFDTDWYLQQNPDVAKAGVNPLAHYLRQGALEGRDPNPLFDTDWYLQQNPDVAKAGESAGALPGDRAPSKDAIRTHFSTPTGTCSRTRT